MLLDEFTVFKSRYPAHGLYIDLVEAVPFAFYSIVVEMILQIPFGLPKNLCRKCMYELKAKRSKGRKIFHSCAHILTSANFVLS